jgi:inosine-uridine nucleoside N-ribohydrolase
MKIHYDCDPGQDDAIALLYALGSKNIEVQSISVVGGNIDVDQCARNALQLSEVTNRTDISVYKGASKPLERPLIMLPHVFGPTGMAGAEHLPQPTIKPQNKNAIDFLCDDFAFDTIVATGPLTNLAMALKQKPELSTQIKNLIIMGGCLRPDPIFNLMGNLTVKGNKEGKAEYNFAVDPEAAQIVFQSGIENITMIGLDVTRTVLFSGAIEKWLMGIGTNASMLSAQILASVGEEDREEYKDQWSYPYDPVRAIHDIVAMAYADTPEIFETEMLPIRIDVDDIPGQSVIDEGNTDCNVTVIKDLDREAFVNHLGQNLSKV